MTTEPVRISYEIFPARDPASTTTLDDLMTSMASHGANLVSVTFGAGGSSTEHSVDTVRHAARTAECSVAAHLTCVGQSRSEVLATAERLLDAGASDLVLLRGDPPTGIDAAYRPHPAGFATTAAFVRAIRDRVDQRPNRVRIAVSGYPEVHPSSPSLDHDLDVLAAKESAGADSITTQMCFDAEAVLRYRDAVQRRGVGIPLSIGVMPLIPFDRIASMAGKCGTRIPSDIREQAARDTSQHAEVATRIAIEFIERLRREGITQFHLYTLNRHDPAVAIISQVQELSEALT